MMFASKCVFLGVTVIMFVSSEGSAFLHAMPIHSADRVSTDEVKNSLLTEIEGSLGVGIASKRVSEMVAVLSPMFASLPKNEHGNLEHVTVRYVLHRVFVQRHGWSIKGLDAAGDSWNSSSPTGILKDHVPSYIENMFEERLGGQGLGLQELAVFAATIEHLIHNEAVGRLGSALNVHKLLPTASMTFAQAHEVLDTYMMAYILGEHLSGMTREDAQENTDKMHEVFLAWNDTQQFVRKIMQETTSSMSVDSYLPQRQVSFAMLAKAAETVGEQFGQFQDAECKGLKAALVKMEDRGTGRVRISDFYKGALGGAEDGWQFQESIPYLRELGVLDESNTDEPRVMIANYLTSQANCIASSDYYSVCCLNECEDLVGHLEKDIAGPEASASRIADLVAALPSASVSAPRELSATLRTRLDKIGADHGGHVQLHSRLFSQWMHHAYPRECPYPHMSGTTSQQSAEDWEKSTAFGSSASHEELKQFTTSVKQSEAVDDMHDLMMWSHEEELLIVRPTTTAAAQGGFASRARNLVLGAALVSVVVGLLRTVVPAAGTNDKAEKFMV